MRQYLDLLETVLKAPVREDRTGVGTSGIFGHQMRFNLQEGFPLLTTKKLHLKSIIHELLWFLQGDTNIKYLQENGVKIWDEWADENGDLGPVYGKQWRDWPKFDVFPGDEAWVVGQVDQISDLVKGLRETPFSRRHMVSAWNPAEITSMALPPCHCLFQCYVRKATFRERAIEYRGFSLGILGVSPDDALALTEEMDAEGVPSLMLDLQLYQRSADVFLGVPFNIASYSLLLMMLAQVTGMIAGDFIWTGGDTHLYLNHREQAKEQLGRKTLPLPTMVIKGTDIFSFKYEDFTLSGYAAHPSIKAEVAK